MSHRGIEDVEKHYSGDGQCIDEEGAGQQGTVPAQMYTIITRLILPHTIENRRKKVTKSLRRNN